MPTYSTATRYLCARGFRTPAMASLSTPAASPPPVMPSGAGSGGSEDRWSLAGGVGSAREGSQGRLAEAAGLLALMAIAAWVGEEARVFGGVCESKVILRGKG